MIWALDLDDFRNVCDCEEYPLLKTINRALRNYPQRKEQCSLEPMKQGKVGYPMAYVFFKLSTCQQNANHTNLITFNVISMVFLVF